MSAYGRHLDRATRSIERRRYMRRRATARQTNATERQTVRAALRNALALPTDYADEDAIGWLRALATPHDALRCDSDDASLETPD